MGFLSPLSPEEAGEQGDEFLNEARDLVTDDIKSVIGEGDLRVIEERIEFAREVRGVLKNKTFIQKIIHTRKYYKTAKGVYQETKFISDRAHDRLRFHTSCKPQPGTSSKTGSEDVYRIARSLYQCLLSCKDAFPSPPTQDLWVMDAWNVACNRIDAQPNSLRQDDEIKCDSMELLADMKTKVKYAVDFAYGFDTGRSRDSITRNVTHAQALLVDATFIYRDLDLDPPCYPYRHPAIQKVVNLTLFGNKDGIGIVFPDYFSPISFEVIALAATVVECRIDEWSTGTLHESSWKEERCKEIYVSHLNTLIHLDTHGPRSEGRVLMQQIQCELLSTARLHAGASASPDRTLGHGRLTVDALDAAIHNGSPRHDLDRSRRSFEE